MKFKFLLLSALIFVAVISGAFAQSDYFEYNPDTLYFKYLKPEDLHKTKLILPEPFDRSKALKALYPGCFYTFKDEIGYDRDSVLMTLWKCPTCQKSVFNVYEDYNICFPDADDTLNPVNVVDYEKSVQIDFNNHDGMPNRTELAYVIDTVIDGKKLKYLLFSSDAFDGDAIHSGRDVCAVLGIAEFEWSDNQWKLTLFDPVAGCNGNFSYISRMQLLRLGGNKNAFYTDYTLGGPGGPFYSINKFYAPFGGKYRVILELSDRALYPYDSDQYNAEITCDYAEGKPFGDIKVVSKGHYKDIDTATYEFWYPPYFADKLLKKSDGRKEFDFEYETIYAFDGKKYELRSEEVRIR